MKALLIMKREYLEHVRKRSFIIGTILAPVIMLALYSIPIAMMFFEPDESMTIAVLDRTGIIGVEFIATLDDTLQDGSARYDVTLVRPAGGDFDAERLALIERVQADEINVVIELPEDALATGSVGYISKSVLNDQVMDRLRNRLNPIVIEKRFAAAGFEAERLEELTRRIHWNEQKITKAGILQEEEAAGDFIIGIVFVMILYFMLLSWGIMVQRSIIEEKSSRVVEVLLSSVDPKDLLLGKLLGVGAAGFTQIAIWGVLFLSFAASTMFAAAQFADFVQVSLSDVLYLGLFFVLGFFFYAALFTIIGSMCSTEQDAQQLQTAAIMPLVVPIMFMTFVMQNPDSTISVVLSLIPLFTPMLMLARVAASEPAWWQVVLSVVLLILSTWGVTVFSAKVYRVGILMYGKRPSLKEVIRWARYA